MMQQSALFVVPIRCHIGFQKSLFNPVQLIRISSIVPCVFALLLCILLSSHTCGLF